jgi:peptidoglycan/xylan/chitin deacetylase (PgdA/CDA1 family)
MNKTLVVIFLIILYSCSSTKSTRPDSSSRAPSSINPVTPASKGKITFTFDDGLENSLTVAAPILKKYGFSGTLFVIPDCVDMVTVPNTCKANPNGKYLTWAQIATLKNTYGWSIESHSLTHPLLASIDQVDQPVALTEQEIIDELVNSKEELASKGYNATSIAPPYGDYNAKTLSLIARYYASQRGFQDVGFNDFPYADYLIRDQHIEGKVSVATVKGYIDTALANNQWLVLTFHNVKTKANTNPDAYEYGAANFETIVSYVKSKNMPVVSISDGIKIPGPQLMANSTFNEGIGGGWRTNNPTAIFADNLNNGSYPDSQNSIKFAANSSPAHLFSPMIPVQANTIYIIKNFLKTEKINSGETFFYIDEYDIDGNWISGQYLKGIKSAFVDSINLTYSPTSANVKNASLQVGISPNSGIVAYLDNVQWIPIIDNNLLTNGNFIFGISNGWSTNSASAVLANNLGFGVAPEVKNSIKFTASTSVEVQLFSPMVAVTRPRMYTLSAYINMTARKSGEANFFIEEFNSAGKLISSQKKAAINTLLKSTINFDYTPTSSSVVKSRLRVSVQKNTGIVAYVDRCEWMEK